MPHCTELMGQCIVNLKHLYRSIDLILCIVASHRMNN